LIAALLRDFAVVTEYAKLESLFDVLEIKQTTRQVRHDEDIFDFAQAVDWHLVERNPILSES